VPVSTERMTTRGAPDGTARRPPLVVIGGGVRAGKSRFALERARQLGGPRRAFVATAEPLDGEMAERIARHQDERRGASGVRSRDHPVHHRPARDVHTGFQSVFDPPSSTTE